MVPMCWTIADRERRESVLYGRRPLKLYISFLSVALTELCASKGWVFKGYDRRNVKCNSNIELNCGCLIIACNLISPVFDKGG